MTRRSFLLLYSACNCLLRCVRMICIVTYVIGCLFQLYIYIYMLFYYRQSNSHGLLAAIVCVIIGLRTHFGLRTCLPHITHILFSWTVSIVLPNHTQFIPVNRMLYIAHVFIWLPVSFVPPHPKQLIELNRMPYITHTTKFRTVFDAPVIANVLHLFDGFFTPPFAIMASHTVSSKGLWL